MINIELLSEICEAAGAPGHEKKIREIKSKHIRDSLTQLIRTARND